MPSFAEAVKNRLPDSGIALLHYMQLVSRVCNLDRNTLTNVTSQAIESTPLEERFVSFNKSVYLARHAGVLIGALVMDSDGFRGFLGDAIEKEIYLDGVSQEKRKISRGELVPRDFERDRYAVTGLCMFNHDTFMTLFGMAAKSLTDLNGTKFTQDVDEAFKKYTEDDAALVGILLSNFYYLVRALNNDRRFHDELQQRVRNIMFRYGITLK